MATESVAQYVWFSPKILSDYQTRGVFEDLIRDYGTPLRDGHGCLLRGVPKRAALSILEDCIAQRNKRNGVAGRGLKIAYNVLYDKLTAAIGGLDSYTYYYLHCGSDAFRDNDKDVRALFARLGIPEARESGL